MFARLLNLFALALICGLSSAFAPSKSSMFSTQLNMADVQTGTVKWFDTTKGFGFITPAEGGDDIFVHQTVIKADGFRSLADGEPVEYTTEEDNNGRIRASSCTGPDGSNVQGAPRRESFYEDDGYY